MTVHFNLFGGKHLFFWDEIIIWFLMSNMYLALITDAWPYICKAFL